MSSFNQIGNELPGRAPFGNGYIYVVGFSGGTVKVGLTNNARNRIDSHGTMGAAFGQTITFVWVSPAHQEYRDNEDVLIAFCNDHARERNRAEYFMGIKPEAVCEFAQTLPMTSFDYEQYKRESQKRDKVLSDIAKQISSDMNVVRLPWITASHFAGIEAKPEWHEIISKLFGLDIKHVKHFSADEWLKVKRFYAELMTIVYRKETLTEKLESLNTTLDYQLARLAALSSEMQWRFADTEQKAKLAEDAWQKWIGNLAGDKPEDFVEDALDQGNLVEDAIEAAIINLSNFDSVASWEMPSNLKEILLYYLKVLELTWSEAVATSDCPETTRRDLEEVW